MPRQLRVEYPGAIYHITSRGGRKNVSADGVRKLDPKNTQGRQLFDALEKAANDRDTKEDIGCHHDDRLN